MFDCISATSSSLKGMLMPFERAVTPANSNGPIERRERLGGLLNFYDRRAA